MGFESLPRHHGSHGHRASYGDARGGPVSFVVGAVRALMRFVMRFVFGHVGTGLVTSILGARPRAFAFVVP